MLDFFIVTYLGHQWARKISIAVMLLAGVMIIYNISYIFYYYGRMAQPVSDLSAKSLLSTHMAHKESDIELFGHYRSQGSTDFMPISQLNLTLESVMSNLTDPKRSSALISAQRQPSKVYYPGDEILPGIMLDKVLDDSVVIDNNHRLEMIKLPRASNGSGIMSVEIEHAN